MQQEFNLKKKTKTWKIELKSNTSIQSFNVDLYYTCVLEHERKTAYIHVNVF